MIKLIVTPQRADYKAIYQTKGDVLTVTIDDKTEVFDFSSTPEGAAEEITVELLPVNPIVSASKTADTVDVTVIRFYGADEKELIENGENKVER